MKALLEEYGEALVACIIACLLIPFMLYAVKNFYKNVYPSYNQDSMAEINKEIIHNSGSPELVAPETFRIRTGDNSYKTKDLDPSSTEYQAALNKYKAIAVAYATGTGDQNHKDVEVPVTVYGTESIDVDKFGNIYVITFVAKNNHGHTTTKQVEILIG